MTDKEILLAMSDMLQPIKSDIQDMKGDIRELKEDVQGLKEDVQGLKEDVRVLKKDMQVLKGEVRVLQSDMEEVKDRLTKIELTQENTMLPRLQNIESCYLSTYERYKESLRDNEELKRDVSVIKVVLTDYGEILQRIS